MAARVIETKLLEMANRRSSALIADRMLNAPLGPIPFTAINFLYISKSSFDRKPNK